MLGGLARSQWPGLKTQLYQKEPAPLRKPSPDLTLNLPFIKNKGLDPLITRLSLAVMVLGASFFRDDIFKGLSI